MQVTLGGRPCPSLHIPHISFSKISGSSPKCEGYSAARSLTILKDMRTVAGEKHPQGVLFYQFRELLYIVKIDLI